MMSHEAWVGQGGGCEMGVNTLHPDGGHTAGTQPCMRGQVGRQAHSHACSGK